MKNVIILFIITISIYSCQSNKPAKSEEKTSVVSSENEIYKSIKSEYQLFGSWIIKNTFTNTQYPYEIYQKGSEYVGIIPEGEYKREKLVKDGNKYVVVGNKYGEYYLIDSDKNMKLFDRDGDLSSTGYKAVKK